MPDIDTSTVRKTRATFTGDVLMQGATSVRFGEVVPVIALVKMGESTFKSIGDEEADRTNKLEVTRVVIPLDGDVREGLLVMLREAYAPPEMDDDDWIVVPSRLATVTQTEPAPGGPEIPQHLLARSRARQEALARQAPDTAAPDPDAVFSLSSLPTASAPPPATYPEDPPPVPSLQGRHDDDEDDFRLPAAGVPGSDVVTLRRVVPNDPRVRAFLEQGEDR